MIHSKREDLIKLLDKIKGLPVLVIGDLMLDRYVWGSVDRISQEAPVPVVLVKRNEDRLGGAANVAKNLANLGARVTICGFIGDDSEGQIVLALLQQCGINQEGVMTDRDRPTTLKTRVIAHAQQVVRIDREELNTDRGAINDSFSALVADQAENSKAIIISDYGKGAVTSAVMARLMELKKNKKIGLGIRPLVVDPNPVNYHLYAGLTIARPNRKEAEAASGIKITDKDSALKAAKIILKKWDAEIVAPSLGEDGLLIVGSQDDKGVFLEAVAKQVYDVSGAGDCVTALFSAAIAAGASPALAGDLANIGAGVVVSEVGTVAVTLAKLKEEINKL